MTDNEFEFVVKAIEFMIEHAQKFLPQYWFDIDSGSWVNKSQGVINNFKFTLSNFNTSRI